MDPKHTEEESDILGNSETNSDLWTKPKKDARKPKPPLDARSQD